MIVEQIARGCRELPRPSGLIIGLALLMMAVLAGAPVLAGDGVDWNRYCMDGDELTTNYAVAFLKVPPGVDVTATGKSSDEMNRLVDGEVFEPVVWPDGVEPAVTFDLRAERLVSAVVFYGSSHPLPWRIETSLDGAAWMSVPPEQIVPVGKFSDRGYEGQAAANLARLARYVRMQGSSAGAALSEVFIYGDRENISSAIGGVYPSWRPPVARQRVGLRALVRNVTDKPLAHVQVAFAQKSPEERVLGSAVIDAIPPGSARVCEIPWVPAQTEPHRIEVLARSEGGERLQGRQTTIAVVNRKLYFPMWAVPDWEQYANVNMDTRTEAFWYYRTRFRGGVALTYATGPSVSGNIGIDRFVETWMRALRRPLADGIALDEWGSEPSAEAAEALKRVYDNRGDKMVVAWLAGHAGGAGGVTATTFRHSDLVIEEQYINYSGHQWYRQLLDRSIEAARNDGLIDRWLMALGAMGEGHPSTLRQIDSEVRYLRYRGPEMPGVLYYGYGGRELAIGTDALCYRYFVAPVVRIDEDAKVDGDSVAATLHNIGGMNAHNVQLIALSADQTAVLARASIPLLKAGDHQTVKLRMNPAQTAPVVRVLSSDEYTALNVPEPLEVYPPRQVSGMPVTLCWTPPRAGPPPPDHPIGAADTLKLVEASSGIVHRTVTALRKRGSWQDRDFYLDRLDTSGLPPAPYLAQLVDGNDGRVRATATFELIRSAGDFVVSKVNGNAWSGDPHNITLHVNDSFELSWDLSPSQLQHCGIYISAPGDELKMPRPDGSYAVARIPDLASAGVSRASGANPVEKGSLDWKPKLGVDDLYFWHRPQMGWLRFRGDVGGRELRRVNVCQVPGRWRLWIGGDRLPAWPLTPVVNITVRGGPAQAPDATDLNIAVDAPQMMTTGDVVPVRVKVKLERPAAAKAIERIELFKTDAPDGDSNKPAGDHPRLLLEAVENPDQAAGELTARFAVSSPEAGEQWFVARVVAGQSQKLVSFRISVKPKVIKVGEKGSVQLTSVLPLGVFDTDNYLYGTSLFECRGKPQFGAVGDGGVRWIANLGELQSQYGASVADANNPDITSPEFAAELALGPRAEPGAAYYLVHMAYVQGSGRWRLIRVEYR